MIHIAINIDNDGVNISITTPHGEKLKFRSSDEQSELMKATEKITRSSKHTEQIVGKSLIENAKERFPTSLKDAGKKVKDAVEALQSGKVVFATAVPKKRKSPDLPEKICLHCNQEFKPRGVRQLFCTITCKKSYNANAKTTKDANALADKLEIENADAHEALKEKEQDTGVGKLVEQIAHENPELADKKLCKECGTSFKPKHADDNYCSERCRHNSIMH